MTVPRRIKFIWGASKVVRGKWYLGLFGLYNRREGVREDGIAISGRGLLLWGAGLAGVAWVALATAGFWFWQRNPYSLLTYQDALLYPLRRAAIVEKRGKAYLAEGLDLVRAERWADGANLLRLGLARYPHDPRARLALAQFHQLTNQYARALRTLTEGLGDEYPGREYAQRLVRLTQQGEDFDTGAEWCARLLPLARKPGLDVERRWLVEQRFAALLAAGRPAEALALAEAEDTGDLREERRVLALLDLGRPADALAVLADWRARPGADLKVVHRLAARAYREAGRLDAMELALEELRQRSPADPGALVFGIVQRALAGRHEAAAAALADYVFRFGGFAENLNLAAGALAEAGNLPLLRTCVAAVRERGFPLGPVQIHLLHTLLRHGEWDEAVRLLESLPALTAKDARDRPWREWLAVLLEAARNPSAPAQQALVEFLRGRIWSIDVFRRSAEAMIRGGKIETARQLVDMGIAAYPASKSLQATRTEVKLLEMARTPAQLPAAVSPTRAAEAAFDQRLAYLLRAKLWEEARRHLAQLDGLASPPAWRASREPAIRLAQVRIAQALGERPAMVLAARALLDGSVPRATKLLEVARNLLTAGERDDAIVLAREIVQSTPGFALAQRSLREWDPPAAGPTPGPDRAPLPAADRPEDLLARLRACHTADDIPGLRTAARLFLNGERARAEKVLAIAREWSAAGDRAAADLLIKEVLQRHEDFPPARRLQQELGPGGTTRK
jgi:tetratricopeptide (TPR) repeat protein